MDRRSFIKGLTALSGKVRIIADGSWVKNRHGQERLVKVIHRGVMGSTFYVDGIEIGPVKLLAAFEVKVS